MPLHNNGTVNIAKPNDCIIAVIELAVSIINVLCDDFKIKIKIYNMLTFIHRYKYNSKTHRLRYGLYSVKMFLPAAI